MLNNFLPDYNLGVVGSWSKEAVYNPLWDCEIPDIIRPTMFVLDVTDHLHDLFEISPAEYPIIAVHKIPSFKEVYLRNNKVSKRYFKGYTFVSHGRFYDRDAYFMLVYVEKDN